MADECWAPPRRSGGSVRCHSNPPVPPPGQHQLLAYWGILPQNASFSSSAVSPSHKYNNLFCSSLTGSLLLSPVEHSQATSLSQEPFLLLFAANQPFNCRPPLPFFTMAAVQKTAGGNSAFHNFHNDFAHITDPNERRRLALAEIDKAPFGWYHVRACVVAGIGFFTDSYDVRPLYLS